MVIALAERVNGSVSISSYIEIGPRGTLMLPRAFHLRLFDVRSECKTLKFLNNGLK